jgi:hypothetical protein
MPYQEPDPLDPMMLVGVEIPGGREALRDMAWVVAEEYARMGHPPPRILALFRTPFFAAAHEAWRVLGEEEIAVLVGEAVTAWGSVRVRDVEAAAPSACESVIAGCGATLSKEA